MMSAPIDLRNASSSAAKSAVLDSQNNPIAIPPMPDYNGRILAYKPTWAGNPGCWLTSTVCYRCDRPASGPAA